jgi:hypothetical protein
MTAPADAAQKNSVAEIVLTFAPHKRRDRHGGHVQQCACRYCYGGGKS